MINIKQNEKPNLPVCVMNCDGGLHDKLDKYDLTKFLNNHSTNLLIGKSGSGKTSLLYSFFKSPKLFRKVYHTVYLFQPQASRHSMNDKIFETLPEDQKYDELTAENLYNVMDKIKNEDKDFNNAILIDDMGAYLKDNDNLKVLKELIFNRRHMRTSIWFLTQTYISVPKEIRKLFSNIFVFRVSKTELTTIFDELVEQKKEYITELSKLVYDKPHQYLFINTDSQRLFKGFDELIIEDK
jgi:DNA replication protein DnaC